MILTLAFATVLPCTLSPGLMLDLPQAREMAATFDVPTMVAAFPDPMFGDERPITIEVMPLTHPRRGSLVIVTSHTEAIVLPDAEHVTESRVLDRVEVTWNGLVLGGGTCDARVSQATTAIDAMLHPE